MFLFPQSGSAPFVSASKQTRQNKRDRSVTHERASERESERASERASERGRGDGRRRCTDAAVCTCTPPPVKPVPDRSLRLCPHLIQVRAAPRPGANVVTSSAFQRAVLKTPSRLHAASSPEVPTSAPHATAAINQHWQQTPLQSPANGLYPPPGVRAIH